MTQKRGPVASDAAADIINQTLKPPGSPGDFGLEGTGLYKSVSVSTLCPHYYSYRVVKCILLLYLIGMLYSPAS